MSVDAELEWLLAEVEGPLAQAEFDLRQLEEHVRQLRDERYGLQVALARVRSRRAPPADATVAGGRGTEDWAAISRAEAVEAALAEATGPLTRTQVVARLTEAGRAGDDADAVSAALAYLLRTGRAARVGRGQWVPAPAPSAIEPGRA